MARILIVDDEKNVQRTLAITLRRAGHTVDAASSGEEAVERVETTLYDLVLTDLRMRALDGLGVLAAVKERDPETEVLLMSAVGSVESAVKAMQGGARDFLEKPFTPEQLLNAVGLALERRDLKSEVRSLRRALDDPNDPETVVAESPSMKAILELVDDWAASTSSILITGETGTGKDLIARTIQQRSPRKDRPFVVVNCATIPKTLFESELFGHVKGAYSGALRNRKGLAQEAHGGTLFLDEIGELPLDIQPQLLRFLESGEVRPLGQNISQNIDVRVIAATNRDLRSLVNEKAFREDLYYRLNVLPLEVEPLRRRREDIEPIVQRCLARFARRLGREEPTLSKKARALLHSYRWPGNVRELQNLMERATMLARDGEIRPEHLTMFSDAPRPESGGGGIGEPLPLAEIERRHILAVLDRAETNQRQAAKILGISKSTLWRKLKEYEQEDARDPEA